MKRLGLLDLVDNLSKKTRCLLKKKILLRFQRKKVESLVDIFVQTDYNRL